MDDLFGRHFGALVLVVLFAILLYSQRNTRDKELRYFWVTLISCFLLVIQDWLELITSEDPSLRFWRTLLSVAGYVFRSTAAVGLVLVVCKPEHRSKALWIPCLVNLAVCSTAFFSDIAFGFDEEYKFYRGPLGYVSFVVPILYLIMILWMTYKRYKDSGFMERMFLVVCALICLISAALDTTMGGVRLNQAIISTSIFFYLFLRSYDVRRDALTNLLNRQSLYNDCETLNRKICAVASVDMDGLKALNDSRGHEAGDEALRAIGRCMQEATDSKIRAYRIGGDEFVLLYARADENAVRENLEEIRRKVKEAGYSISIGYAMREEKDNPESMIRRSDIKMFEQKAKYYREKQHDRRRNRRDSSGESGFDRFRKAVEDLQQPVAVYRLDNHRIETLAVSDGFCRLFGYPDRMEAVFVLDHDRYRNVHPDDRERFSGAILQFADGNEDLDVIYRSSTGMTSGYRVVHERGVHIHTETGARLAHVWYMDEGVYTEENQGEGSTVSQALNAALHEESILHAINYDTLTELPTLPWFFKLFEAQKAKIQNEGSQISLLYMDLSGMKYFNDKHGFAEGDRMLRAFGKLLAGIFGKDGCCHIAADRFAACAPRTGAEERIRKLFTEASRMNDGKTLPIRIGIYSMEMEDVPVTTAYDRAKTACDAIRKSDSSCFNVYSKELRDAVRKQQYLIENIDRAIAENWIQVYYQPIVRAVNGKMCDEEALARWIDPVKGFMAPGEFIPQLEKAGLIYKLDLCVLDQVLEKIRVQMQDGVTLVPHSINLSRADFDACDMVGEIRKRVDEAGVSHDRITIEITESVIGSDFEFMKEQIRRFRELGFAVWMDDFGSGYSSLDVLQSIKFDLIKFDMSFMRRLDEGEQGKIILTEMMKMASSLGLDTVCEGVETEEQARFLQEIGCSKLQGFLFGKPEPIDEIKKRYYLGERIGFEDPEASAYYDTIGRADLHDLSIVTGVDGMPLQNTFDSVPASIVEIRDGKARYARSNPSYREFARRFYGSDPAEMTREYVTFGSAFMEILSNACREAGNQIFSHNKMSDGSVVHSFARRIAVYPKEGIQAVAVAVLSITDPADAQAQEAVLKMTEERDALARIMAIAEDYISLYSVNPETGQFVVYTASPEYEELDVPKEGSDFFAQTVEDAKKYICPEDLPKFLENVTREKILRSIEETGRFSMSYKMMLRNEPTAVSLKIAVFQTEREKKLLAGVRKWRIRK